VRAAAGSPPTLQAQLAGAVPAPLSAQLMHCLPAPRLQTADIMRQADLLKTLTGHQMSALVATGAPPS
jgi:hypothetical protein